MNPGIACSRLAMALLVGLIVAAPAGAQQNDATDAGALEQQFIKLYQQGRYADAIPLAQRLLDIQEKALGPEHPDVATSLSNLAILYTRQGRHAEAETLYRRALAIREKALGPEHPDVAVSLNNLARLYDDQGRYAEAEKLYRRSLTIREKALGPEHPSVATALNNLASLSAGQGRYAEAEKLYRRALAIREKALGPEHPSVATVLNNLASLYKAQGRYAEAEPLYKRDAAITEKALGPDHPDVAASQNNLAGLYRLQGRYAEAEPAYKRSLAVVEKALGPEHPFVAASLNNLAELYERQGRTIEAEPLYRRALAIWEKALGPEHPDVAAALNNLASLYKSLGRYDEAEPLYLRDLAITEKALGPEHPSVAASLNNLAGLYENQGRYATAEPLYQRALAVAEKALGPEHPSVAVSLNNLAGLYRSQGRYAEAETLYRRSLAIKENALGPEHPDVATSLSNLAGLYESQGRAAEAEPLYRRSLAIKEKALGPLHPDVATVLNNLARLYAGEDRAAEAYDHAHRALVILRDRALAGAGQDAERQSNRASFLFFLSVAAAQAGKAPDQRDAIADEAVAAMQLAGQSSADRALAQASLRFASGSDSLARVVRERQDAADRIGTLDKAIVAAASQPPEKRDRGHELAIRDERTALDRTLGEIDARLRREFPRFADLANPRPLAVAETQKLLAADEAVVAFVVAGDATYRFIIGRDRAEFRRIDIKRSAIEEQAIALRLALDPTGGRSLSDLRYDAGEAHALYTALFDGALPLLAGVRRLLIVPDGPLAGLPFSVLPTEPPPADASGFALYRRVHWLARDYAIAVLPSVGALRALRIFAADGRSPREPFLGFGDPDLKGRPGDVKGKARQRLAARGVVADVSAVEELDALPETAKELRQIARALHADPATSTLLRAEATERHVKTMDLSRYRVLAFATHGLMAEEFEGYGEPALVLTPPEKGDEEDDGLLSASEVAQLKLDADWVILSACNTAAPDGSPGAEGLSGLARAFFYAGSRALLVSHWPVLSDASVRLTTGAIERLANAPLLGRAEALRQSMLALLDDESLPAEYAHPAVWAPFSLVGEGAPGR